MPQLDPPAITPDLVISSLGTGRPVALDAPGWSDTARRLCPECGCGVMFFRRSPAIQFEYGREMAVPHRCGRHAEDFERRYPDFLAQQDRDANNAEASRFRQPKPEPKR
jgi:hypothetical protein